MFTFIKYAVTDTRALRKLVISPTDTEGRSGESKSGGFQDLVTWPRPGVCVPVCSGHGDLDIFVPVWPVAW